MFEVLSGCNVIGHGIFGSMASNSEPPQSPNYDNIEMEGIGSLTLPNSLKAPFERFELIGNTTQTTTKGINLIPFKVGEKIVSENKANTVEFEKDGVNITINTFPNLTESDLYFFGKATGGDIGDYSDELEAGDYTFLSNSKTSSLYVVVWRNGTTKIIVEYGIKPIIHFTLLDGDKVRLFLRPKRTEIKNEKAQVMLCKHTEVNLSYEPYTDRKQSPSPEYQQEIVNVGRKSENLFDINSEKNGFITGSGTVSIPINNNNEKYSDYILINKSFESICATAYVTVPSTEGAVPWVGLAFYDKDKNFIVRQSAYMKVLQTKIPQNAFYVIGTYRKYKDGILQMEYGEEFVNVSITGKNLAKENLRSVNNIWSKPVLLKKGISYTLSSSRVINLYFDDAETKETIKKVYGAKQLTYTPAKDICAIVKMYDEKSILQSDYLQLEIGTIATSYEPYREPQEVQLQLDSPLTKWDKIEKRDGVWGIAKNSNKTILDETKNVNQYFPHTVEGLKCYQIQITDAYKGFQNSLCTHFRNINEAWKNDIGTEPMYSDHGLGKVKFFVSDKQTAEEFKTWLIQQKEAGTPVELLYKTEKETWKPFPEETQLALGNLHSNDGTTIITVDSGEAQTGIKLTYRKEK